MLQVCHVCMCMGVCVYVGSCVYAVCVCLQVLDVFIYAYQCLYKANMSSLLCLLCHHRITVTLFKPYVVLKEVELVLVVVMEEVLSLLDWQREVYLCHCRP